MTFTKTSQKFGQWADSRANTVFGLGFSSEQQLTKVTWPPPQRGTCRVGGRCHWSSLVGGWSGVFGEQSSSLPSMSPFLLGCQPGRAFRNTRFLANGGVVGGSKTYLTNAASEPEVAASGSSSASHSFLMCRPLLSLTLLTSWSEPLERRSKVTLNSSS